MISDVLYQAIADIEDALVCDAYGNGYSGGVRDEIDSTLRAMRALLGKLDNPNTVWPVRAMADEELIRRLGIK